MPIPVEDLEHVHGVEPVPQPGVEMPRPLEQAKVDRPVALLPENSVANSWQDFSARCAVKELCHKLNILFAGLYN